MGLGLGLADPQLGASVLLGRALLHLQPRLHLLVGRLLGVGGHLLRRGLHLLRLGERLRRALLRLVWVWVRVRVRVRVRCTAAETYWLTYTALPSGAAKKMESPSLAKDSESVPGEG